MTMTPVWTTGRCRACGKKRDLYRGTCWLCRHPKECRELLEAGIPSSSAIGLLYLARKCGSITKAMKVLNLVHSNLMENISVGAGFVFQVKDKQYYWIRRAGWAPRP